MPSRSDDAHGDDASADAGAGDVGGDADSDRVGEHGRVDGGWVDAAHAAIARATAREVAVHQVYDRARNVLRARARRRALVGPARERFSSPGRADAFAGASTPALAWGLPLSRRGDLLAVISPTASAITPLIRQALAPHPIVVASYDEQERIRKVCDPRQRFVVLSVHVPEPQHEAIVDYARRNPTLGVARVVP